MADVHLKRGDVKRDCPSEACPEMVVVPAGSLFLMDEKVTIAEPFLVSKYEVTFAEWDKCYDAGGCSYQPAAQDWGRSTRPVINVSWNDAQQYLRWLSTITGMPYRLLTQVEWEYAARGVTEAAHPQPGYSWGDQVGVGNANCNRCGSQWDNRQTAPVGSFKPNAFGLYDMHGNVAEWTGDCPRSFGDCPVMAIRGGSWSDLPNSVGIVLHEDLGQQT